MAPELFNENWLFRQVGPLQLNYSGQPAGKARPQVLGHACGPVAAGLDNDAKLSGFFGLFRIIVLPLSSPVTGRDRCLLLDRGFMNGNHIDLVILKLVPIPNVEIEDLLPLVSCDWLRLLCGLGGTGGWGCYLGDLESGKTPPL